MGERVLLAPNGVYRTPGRTAPAPRIPRPSWRTLLAPLGHGVFSVLLVVSAIATNGKTVVVEATCPWKQRAIWERRMVYLVGTLTSTSGP